MLDNFHLFIYRVWITWETTSIVWEIRRQFLKMISWETELTAEKIVNGFKNYRNLESWSPVVISRRWYISQFFCPFNKISDTIKLMKRKVLFSLIVLGYYLLSIGSIILGLWQVSTSWWKHMAEQNCSPHSQNAKNKGGRHWNHTIPFNCMLPRI